jgi:hypothetical protein
MLKGKLFFVRNDCHPVVCLVNSGGQREYDNGKYKSENSNVYEEYYSIPNNHMHPDSMYMVWNSTSSIGWK